MKLVTTQEELARGLQTAERAVAVRSTVPVLTGVYLEAGQEGLTVRGTNLDMGLQIFISAQVERTGSIVLPARHFTEMVRKAPPGSLELEVGDDALRSELRWGRSKFTLHGLSADDFPGFEEPAGYGGLPFSQAQLRQAIRSTVFCVADDPSRPFLSGVNFTFTEDSISAISSDGFRIAIRECSLLTPGTSQAQESLQGEDQAEEDMDDEVQHLTGDDPFGGRSLLLPAASLNELARNLSDDPDADGIMYLVDNEVYFDLDRVKFKARLIESRFPDLMSLLPSSYVTTIELDRGELLSACERLLLIAQHQDRVVASKIRLEREHMIMTADRPDVGRAYEEIPATVEGKLFPIYMNPRFLVEGLRQLTGDTCTLEISGYETPARLTSPSDQGFIYVVMPVRVE